VRFAGDAFDVPAALPLLGDVLGDDYHVVFDVTRPVVGGYCLPSVDRADFHLFLSHVVLKLFDWRVGRPELTCWQPVRGGASSDSYRSTR